jgi:transcriptional regulator with XRE-family HTH domain
MRGIWLYAMLEHRSPGSNTGFPKEILCPRTFGPCVSRRKLSVATLASRAGLPIGLIMEYESGQRSVDVRHISRLARALYIEESEIKLRSDPRPGAGTLERQPRRDDVPRPAEPSAAPVARPPRDRPPHAPRPAPTPRPPLPARPSQITHLQDLLVRLGRPQAEVEAEMGKPLAELDRVAASQMLVKLQGEMKEGKFAERHRAYLPEAVDQFEFRYLTAAQQAGDVLHFTLFDNSAVAGQVIGFGQYNITVRAADGSEITLNKLAIVSYTKPASGEAQAV